MKNIIIVFLLFFGFSLTGALANESNSIQYKVKAGDNLYNIAKLHGTTVKRLVADNNIKQADLIFPNQILIINLDQKVVPENQAQSTSSIEPKPSQKNPQTASSENSDQPAISPWDNREYLFPWQDPKIVNKAKILGMKWNKLYHEAYSMKQIVESMLNRVRYSQGKRFKVNVADNLLYLDCSAFVYMAQTLYGVKPVGKTTSKIFSGSQKIKSTKEFLATLENVAPGTAFGWGGKHAYIYLGREDGEYLFAHSSSVGHGFSVRIFKEDKMIRDINRRGRGQIYMAAVEQQPNFDNEGRFMTLAFNPLFSLLGFVNV